MATGRSTQLTKQVGEYRVAAELARRNLLAATFSGNVPHYDVIASGQAGGHVPIQVKAKAVGTWQLDIRDFVSVSLRGRKQVLGRAKPSPYPGLIYVFVAVDTSGADRFFIIDWVRLRRELISEYRAYLVRHGGSRPKNPGSFHTGINERQLAGFENKWTLIARRIRNAT